MPKFIEETKEISKMIDSLQSNIRQKDKKGIMDCYEKLQKIDWDCQSDALFNEYEKLIEKGNDIIYET